MAIAVEVVQVEDNAKEKLMFFIRHPPTILGGPQSNPSARQDGYSHTVTALAGSYQ